MTRDPSGGPPSLSAAPMTETTLTYETACARIEEIIRRLDSGEAGLRETLELCQEGRRLVEFCAGELEAVGRGLRSSSSTSWSPGSRRAGRPPPEPRSAVLVGLDQAGAQREQRDLRAPVGGRHVLQPERAPEVVELGRHDLLRDPGLGRDLGVGAPA